MVENYYRDLYLNVPIAYQSLDADGYILDINDYWLDELGFGQAEVLGRWFGDFLSGESRKVFRQNFDRFKKEGRINNVHLEMLAENGSAVNVVFAGKVGFSKTGDFKKIHCVFQRDGNATEGIGDLFHLSVFEQISIPMIIVNPVSQSVIDANNAACELYAAEYKNLINRNVIELTIEKFDKIEILRAQILKGNTSSFEVQIADFNNNIKTVEVFPTVFNTGDHRYTALVLVDITDKKMQAEKLLIKDRISNAFLSHNESEIFSEISEILRETFESDFCYVGYINSENLMVSPSMTTEIWEKCHMQEKTFVFPPEMWGGMWGRSLQERRSFYQNGGLDAPCGHVKLENAMAVVICDGEKLLGQFVVANRNERYDRYDLSMGEHIAGTITPILKFWLENKRSRELLNEKREQLRKQLVAEMELTKKQEQILFEQQKFVDMGQMLSAIAHQWRQPLNNIHLIMHSIKQLHEGREAGFSFEQLEGMHSDAVGFMSRTIDSFRDYLCTRSRSEVFSVSGAILETINLVCAQFQSQDIDISFECSGKEIPTDCDMTGKKCRCESCDDHIEGDISSFHQIILNILSNSRDALLEYRKDYPEKGFIRITGRPEDGMLNLKVFNSGYPISGEVLPKIFDPYFTTKEEGKGTGVGLYMTKMLVEDGFNGSVKAENKSDGVEFTIMIPRVTDNG